MAVLQVFFCFVVHFNKVRKIAADCSLIVCFVFIVQMCKQECGIQVSLNDSSIGKLCKTL